VDEIVAAYREDRAAVAGWVFAAPARDAGRG
jgi:hypothetical protein